MNKICRGCYNSRLLVMAKVKTRSLLYALSCMLEESFLISGGRIRALGGLEELQPSMKMRKACESAHSVSPAMPMLRGV